MNKVKEENQNAVNSMIKKLGQKDSRLLQNIISDYCRADVVPDCLIDYNNGNGEPTCSSCCIQVSGNDRKTGRVENFSLLWLWMKNLMCHNDRMNDLVRRLPSMFDRPSISDDDFDVLLTSIKDKIYRGQYDLKLAGYVIGSLGYSSENWNDEQLQKLVDGCFPSFKH